jgi:hypothetical protein
MYGEPRGVSQFRSFKKDASPKFIRIKITKRERNIHQGLLRQLRQSIQGLPQTLEHILSTL